MITVQLDNNSPQKTSGTLSSEIISCPKYVKTHHLPLHTFVKFEEIVKKLYLISSITYLIQHIPVKKLF